MTALSSEAHPASNGHSVNGNGYQNGYTNGSTPVAVVIAEPAPFANDAFTHLTLYTGNTMRTGTTGQLNTSLKKSNQEVIIHFLSLSLSTSLPYYRLPLDRGNKQGVDPRKKRTLDLAPPRHCSMTQAGWILRRIKTTGEQNKKRPCRKDYGRAFTQLRSGSQIRSALL